METEVKAEPTKTSGEVAGFDFRTEIRDPKTNQVTKKQDYKLHISKENGEMFERPIGSGIWYNRLNDVVKTEKKQATK